MERFLADTQFEPVVLGGIVAAGDHHPPVNREAKEREVQHRGRTDPDVKDAQTTGRETTDEAITQDRRAKPSVPADADRVHSLLSPDGREGPTDLLGDLVRQLLADDATNIIFAKERHLPRFSSFVSRW